MVNSMVKVSVVIPVYNVENYLRECMDSIVNQTLEDIEIICVNDGSTDSSLDILKEYASKDDRITVLSQENGGHAVATNRGIALAKGKYLYLMDSDDVVKTNALKELYEWAEEKNADFVLFQSLNYINDEDRYYKSKIYSMDNVADFIGDSVVDYKDLGDLIFSIPVTPWSKLYNTEFVKNCGATFPEGLIYDDNIFFWDVLFNAKRIAFYKKYFFIRRWHSASSTKKGDLRFIDSIAINNLMINRFKKYGLFNQYKKVLYNRKINLIYDKFVNIMPKYEKDYYEAMKIDFNKIMAKGLYDDYVSVLDDRNLKIFNSCLSSDTYKEFKYEIASFDLKRTNKKLRKELNKYKFSKSWKVTKPFRDFTNHFRK